ncbi:MAG TPA: alcohol dehydrogenase catalytic domain-containing protein, partial [bacterium]|nr:alcohol dehydrogenase catalytic domain-containing protein [bacterium]
YHDGKGFVQLRDVPEPRAGAGEVRIRVEYAGICASDLHILNADIAITVRPPVVMGHEFSGVIDQLGPGVTGWQEGDRVVSETSYEVCGACRYCRGGFYNLCPDRKVLGYWHDGAFAPYTVVPAHRLHRLPPEISLAQGAMVEPTACVCHGVCELIELHAGDVVLVSGPGAIGLTAAQVALAAGATVIVCGTGEDRARLETAARLGAHATVDVSTGDLAARARETTGGEGVDVVIECSGAEQAIRAGMEAVRKQGQFLQLGLRGRDISLPFDTLVYREIRVVGALSSRDVSWRTAIELIRQGKVRPQELVSAPRRLDDWQEAFRAHEQKAELKILFRPD